MIIILSVFIAARLILISNKYHLIGEHVFIYRSIGVESNDEDVQIRWYYLNTLPLQSSIHHNSLPGTTKKRTTQKTDIDSICS
jgi:hypothetical protein